MPKNTLTIEERVRAITLLEEGYSSREVAAKLERNIDHTTILWLNKKYKETGKVKNKPFPGRPRKLTERDERSIVRKILKRECNTAVDIQKTLRTEGELEVSANTIRRTLQRNRLVSRVKRKKPLLSKKYRKTRLEFARESIFVWECFTHLRVGYLCQID